MSESQFTADGFRLAPMGGKRNLIVPEVAAELVQALNALGAMEISVVNTGKTRIFYSQGKIVFQIAQSEVGSSGGGIQAMRVKSVEANYLVCRTFSGGVEGLVDINVARPHNARQPASETIAGTSYSYTYSAGPDDLNDKRESDDGDTTEDQIVTPLWVEDEIIQVARTDYTGVTVGGADLEYIEISPRCWAKIEPPE